MVRIGEQFLPPPPDEVFGSIHFSIGELLKIPARVISSIGEGIANVGRGITGGVESAITELQTLPKR